MTLQVIASSDVDQHHSSPSSHAVVGTVTIGECFRVGKKIGEGKFGTVFEGVNILNSAPVAIKFEVQYSTALQRISELSYFRQLQQVSLANYYEIKSDNANAAGIPRVHYFGQEGVHNVLVIDLLGPNLKDLFTMCDRKFSIKTVCMLAKQMITLVQSVHDKNLIYRAIKPDNFVIGAPGTRSANLIHLIDFGMAKHYRDPCSHIHIPYCEQNPLYGTARYMSINTHLGREQSRRDDLESLGHVFMYFLRGGLPWQGLKTTTDKQRNEKIGEKKESTPISELCEGFPEEFVVYMSYVRKLGFEESPDYDFLCSLFTKVLDACEETDDLQFDWVALNVNHEWEAGSTPSALLARDRAQPKSKDIAAPATPGPIDDLSSAESNILVDPSLPYSGIVADPSGSQSQDPQTDPVDQQQLPLCYDQLRQVEDREEERIREEGGLRVSRDWEKTWTGVIWREWEETWKKIKGRGRKRKELNEEHIRKERIEERKRNGMEVEEVRLRAIEEGRIRREQEGLGKGREFRVVVEEHEERSRLIEKECKRKKKVAEGVDPQTEGEGGICKEEGERILSTEEVEEWREIKEGEELGRKGKGVGEVRLQTKEEDHICKREGEAEWLRIEKGEEKEARRLFEEGRTKIKVEERPQLQKEKNEKKVTFKPSTLVTASRSDSLDEVAYQEDIQSPGPGLNQDAQQGKFKYAHDFLLQLTEIPQEKPADSLSETFVVIRDWFDLPGSIQQLHLWSSEEIELLLSIIEHTITAIEPMKQDSGASAYQLSLCKSWIRKITRRTGVLPGSLILKDVELTEKNPISCGGFADIYKGTYRGSSVAVKVIRTASTKASTQKYHLEVFHEALHWKDLRHEHVVSFLGIIQDLFTPRFGLVSPWMTNGSILQYLEDNPQANRETLLTHSAKGLSYLHAQIPALVHGDIKAANILVDNDGKARLSDFGLISISESQHFQTTSRMSESGSVRWMAPELIVPSREGGTKSRTSDIYAFGMTILEVFTGVPPFFDVCTNDVQVINAIMNGSRPDRPNNESLVSPLSDKLWEVAQHCWATDPKSRPSTEKLIFDLQALES